MAGTVRGGRSGARVCHVRREDAGYMKLHAICLNSQGDSDVVSLARGAVPAGIDRGPCMVGRFASYGFFLTRYGHLRILLAMLLILTRACQVR